MHGGGERELIGYEDYLGDIDLGVVAHSHRLSVLGERVAENL